LKKIALLSDTHGYLDPRIFEYFAECDEIWHAGDFGNAAVSESLSSFKPLRGVYGNVDGQDVRKFHNETNAFVCEGVNVLMLHIGGYPGRYSAMAREYIKIKDPDLFICGHSHILKVMRDPYRPKLLHINPGAAGIEGFHVVRTAVRFEIDKGVIGKLEVIELGKR
jgi:putative phosphoesterase